MSLSEKPNCESQDPVIIIQGSVDFANSEEASKAKEPEANLRRNEVTLSDDENYEAMKLSSSDSSEQAHAAEMTLPPNTGDITSTDVTTSEFIADFATFGDSKPTEAKFSEDHVKSVTDEEGATEPETISSSDNTSSDVPGVEPSNSPTNVQGTTSDSTGCGDTPAKEQDDDGGIREGEAVDLDVLNGDSERADIDGNGAEDRKEEALEAESTPIAVDSSEESLDPKAYEHVAALISGMMQEHIDWKAAQRFVSEDKRNDPILAGFHALLLHPEIFKDGRLEKSEVKSLRTWIRAQDLGLLDEVKAGNAWAQWLKGLFRHVDCKDFASAKEYYELAAAQGNASALQNLGSLYMMGTGVPRDYKRAKEYYEIAAEQGHATAQCCLGLLYLEGNGVQQDCERGVHLFELAAMQGYVLAQYKLGLLYQEGSDIPQDYKKAKQYYELAVEQGYRLAQCNLASMYVKGTGVPMDYERARHLYELGAEQGCVSSQNNLGHLYKNGMGVPINYEKAKEYYEQAAKQGFDPAQSNLANLSQESCVVS